MKRALSFICAVALLAASCSRAGPDDSPRVIVLGIDGGTWTVIQPLLEAGQLPNLKKLVDGGLHGVLESRPPILSPVVWTTIFTGFGFMKHGVRDWKTSQSVNRRVSAIWEILRDRNERVDVFNVPGTWPPDPIPGKMLSGFPLSGATFAGNTGEIVTRDQLSGGGKLPLAYRDNVATISTQVASLEVGKWTDWFPGVVASRPSFRGTMRAYHLLQDEFYLTPLYRTDPEVVVSEPKGLRAEVSGLIGEPYIPEGPGWSRWEEKHTPELLYQHLDQVFSIQSKAAQQYVGGDWDLFLFVMTFVDRISHPYWAYDHPEDFPGLDPLKAARFHGAVANAYRRSDEELGRILAKVQGNPYVLIVSDHGFQSSNDQSKAVGAHHPDGIYILTGPGIAPRTGVPKFIEDVTPTLLYLLNMPVGQDMDGKVFAEAVEMLGRKPQTIATYETGARASTNEPVDTDTWESLRGLGYVDGAPPRADKPKPGEPAKKGKPAGIPKRPPGALEQWPEAPPNGAAPAPPPTQP